MYVFRFFLKNTRQFSKQGYLWQERIAGIVPYSRAGRGTVPILCLPLPEAERALRCSVDYLSRHSTPGMLQKITKKGVDISFRREGDRAGHRDSRQLASAVRSKATRSTRQPRRAVKGAWESGVLWMPRLAKQSEISQIEGSEQTGASVEGAAIATHMTTFFGGGGATARGVEEFLSPT